MFYKLVVSSQRAVATASPYLLCSSSPFSNLRNAVHDQADIWMPLSFKIFKFLLGNFRAATLQPVTATVSFLLAALQHLPAIIRHLAVVFYKAISALTTLDGAACPVYNPLGINMLSRSPKYNWTKT
ncbi:hypothetical protein T4B_3506 [Trichinella pseudospiralis]|uniref:Uncharacterized protein n=1 Tax=Trichinella pseudospiralis TaxID=6337 RepID=A0A0V1DYB3_TRIPS|nr:hypothetical protein T4A_7837 [Trichinella pseudospiralis]KRY66326.1 hypothetical protein T4A_10840 [Trichinella pseudospiralis]KRY99594.1 hypothetical protein T4B_7458 [Trichinella pseudospiralis]KRZ01183.1 hypothetical protein T4B_2110 [Trichinella pseudospiralis]KRZ01342.1 hypothetical protein T4B_3506 [Trichinella pseudospiralis]